MNIVVSILVFGLLFAVHEAGHFLAAKRAGVRVEEFALGVGPRLFGWRWGETMYSLRLLPVLAFVRMAGTDPAEAVIDNRGFNRKTVWQRMGIVAAGPAMNFFLAVLFFTSIFAYFGVPQAVTEEPIIGEVMRGHPAEEAGLRPGDRVLALDGKPVRAWTDLVRVIQASTGKPLAVTVERDGQRLTLRVTPQPSGDRPEKGFIGIAPRTRIVRMGLLASLKTGLLQTVGVSLLWIKSLVLIVTRKMQADVAGPVGIISMLNQATRVGVANLVSLAGALSAILGLTNLLPIPALDGSRLLFLSVEAIRGRPIDPERENFIHFVGFALLMLLALVITYRDFIRLFAGWN